MIYRYALSIIIIIISLFIMNKTQVNIPKKSVEIPQYKIACSENPIIKKIYPQLKYPV
ncbi:hypothetical protein [Marinitoga sp. 1137]|uniref:hypothetical protein n=1 Tax=Marinitoga sp. 1137 TaxID=1545835 RepID=UPI0012EB5092|nr:hypothetical protein [Marinitoga sp. 1137]